MNNTKFYIDEICKYQKHLLTAQDRYLHLSQIEQIKSYLHYIDFSGSVFVFSAEVVRQLTIRGIDVELVIKYLSTFSLK
jgi:hypothetical protein